MTISHKEKEIKDKWHKVVSIREAQTDNGTMYYLMDENLDFIPLVKEYLDMIQARAEREVYNVSVPLDTKNQKIR